MMTHKAMRALLIATGLLTVIPVALGADWVKYQNGLLSVEFVDLELAKALELTTQETGIRFKIDPKVEAGKVSERFDEVALNVAIRRLLRGYNYVVVADNAPKGAARIKQVTLLARLTESERAAQQPPAAPGGATPAGASEVVLRRQEAGHYLAAGKINNRPVEFLVDTGSSFVAVPAALAKEMNLPMGQEKPVDTAKGRSVGYDTVLDRVDVSGLLMNQVQAVILPDMEGNRRVLLGMNFLSAFHLVQQDDSLTIKKR